MGAPSKFPPTLPSFARNSAMVFAFQSSVSLMSNSCRSRSRGMRWDGVMDGAARDDLAVVAEASPVEVPAPRDGRCDAHVRGVAEPARTVDELGGAVHPQVAR